MNKDSLGAARAVESLLNAARDLLADAQRVAEDGSLIQISKWIKDRVDSLDGELLKEVRATVEALERTFTPSSQSGGGDD